MAANQLHVDSFMAGNHPLHAGAVLASLALAGSLQNERGWQLMLRLPLAAIGIVTVNTLAVMLGWIWPRWEGLATSYRILVRKPK